AEIRRIENRLLEILPTATLAGKQYVCRQLGYIGTDTAVPALAALLKQEPTNDMARGALERIPRHSSPRPLRAAITTTSEKSQVGVITSLAQRRDPGSVAALKSLLTSPADDV